MTIYRLLKEQKQKPLLLITAVEGPAQGQQYLFEDGSLLYPQGLDAAMLDDLRTLQPQGGIALLEREGQRFFCERLHQEAELTICGAGHISLVLTRLAKMVGFNVRVIDDRAEFVEKAVEAGADIGIARPFEEVLPEIKGHDSHFFVIVTRGHAYDKECLRLILQKPACYIGMIGSRSKVALTREALLGEGFTQEQLDAVHAPIGLKIGGQSPEEIAVSIIAEVIQEKHRYLGGMGFDDKILAALLDEETSRQGKALLTIIAKQGSSPRAPGTKMLVLEDGSIRGTIGGGIMEYKLIEMALECLKQGEARLVEINMTNDQAASIGMICGGIIEVFIQPVV